jgi:hypothetical protein
MHLIETYALACGAKIDEPYIYEKYFPTPQEEYVTFQPFSVGDIKNYDYWQQVIDLIYPVFQKNNVIILQIGSSEDKTIKGCSHISGHTNINHAAYVIRRGKMHFGTDSFAVHVASGYRKKIVALYSNNIVKNVGPYWSNREDVVLLEPERDGKKPNYALSEQPKSINTIKPEKIAQAICDLLGFDLKSQYETIHIGQRYGEEPSFAFAPDSFHAVEGGQKPIEYRMDYHFNELNLEKQLQACPCGIVTDKTINIDLLKKYRPRVAHLLYLITKGDDPKFVRSVRRLGINIALATELSKDDLKDKRIDYYDIGKIIVVDKPDKNLIKKIKNSENLFYKSNKIIMSNNQTYSSRPKYMNKKPSNGNFEPISSDDFFFDDLDHFHIVKMLDKNS